MQRRTTTDSITRGTPPPWWKDVSLEEVCMVWFHEAGRDRGCWFPGAQATKSDVALDASLMSKRTSNSGVLVHWLIDNEVSWVPWRSKGPNEPCFRMLDAITIK